MKKIKAYKFVIEPYGRRMMVFVGSRERFVYTMKKEYNIDIDSVGERDGEHAYVEYQGKNSPLFSFRYIWLKKLKKTPEYMGLLAHECLHATFEILDWAGMKYTRDGEEAYTYLLDNMIRQILEHYLE